MTHANDWILIGTVSADDATAVRCYGQARHPSTISRKRVQALARTYIQKTQRPQAGTGQHARTVWRKRHAFHAVETFEDLQTFASLQVPNSRIPIRRARHRAHAVRREHYDAVAAKRV